MTTSPVEPPRLIDQIRQIWQRADDLLLTAIARRLLTGRGSTRWLDSRRAATTSVLAELAAIVGDIAAPTETAVIEALTRGYDRGRGPIDADDTVAVAARTAVVGRAVTDVTARLALDQSVMVRQLPQVWRRLILDTEAVLATGRVTRVQAAQQILDRLAAGSVTGLTDRAGRTWEPASWAEMTLRTATTRAQVDGVATRAEETGTGLVMVVDAKEECAKCRPWEGKILATRSPAPGRVTIPSVTGGPPVTLVVDHTVDDARAAGLWHPNCRHQIRTYLPGLTTRPERTADPDGDRQRQRQRELERGLRGARRRLAVAEATRDDTLVAAARTRVTAASAAIADHVVRHDRARLRRREQITRAR